MEATDPEKLADELEGEADDMQQRSESLQHEVSETRQSWERKRADGGVPGANPPEGGDDANPPEGGDDDDADED